MSDDWSNLSPAQRRLAAEALSAADQAASAPNAGALAAARRTSGGLQAQMLAYFAALPEAGVMARTVSRIVRVFAVLVFVAALLAFIAGGATVNAAFGAAGGLAVNFHWAIASILGLNMLMLLVWLIMLVVGGRSAGDHGLGAALIGLWRMLITRIAGSGGNTGRAVTAMGLRLGRAHLWLVSAISHGLWLIFLTGGLVLSLILMSTHQYIFRWETTILTADSYIALTHALAAVPHAVGFAVPDDAAIRAAQWQGGAVGPAGDQHPWSNLFIACLILYGILPRLVLFAFSLWRARKLGWAAPLDLTRPGLGALVPHLAPVVERTSIISPAPEGTDRTAHTLRPLAPLPPPRGAVAVIGWETEAGQALANGNVASLGVLDGAESVKTAIAAIASRSPKLGRLIIVADLATTPDRGVSAGLKPLVAAVPETVILLTGAGALARRLSSSDAADRLTDWVAAAHAAGVPLDHIAEIDLANPGPEGKNQLDMLTGAAP